MRPRYELLARSLCKFYGLLSQMIGVQFSLILMASRGKGTPFEALVVVVLPCLPTNWRLCDSRLFLHGRLKKSQETWSLPKAYHSYESFTLASQKINQSLSQIVPLSNRSSRVVSPAGLNNGTPDHSFMQHSIRNRVNVTVRLDLADNVGQSLSLCTIFWFYGL